jgi:hypothetical protein
MTPGYRRAVRALGVVNGSPAGVAIGATIMALAKAVELPGPADARTTFHPGLANVRRVPGRNFWILYRFDEVYVEVLSLRDAPPVPHDEGDKA